MKKIKIDDIALTLKLGSLSNKKQIILLRCCFIFSILVIIFTVIYFFIPQVKHDKMVYFCFVGVFIIAVSFLSFIIFIWHKDRKIKKLVLLYLEDAVESIGYCSTVKKTPFCFITPSSTKICVKFKYNGKVLKRVSSVKTAGVPKGYSCVFDKYTEREFRILYTPKYDDVMILKDNISD